MTNPISYRFSKNERLYHRKQIDYLFSHGRHINLYPYRFTWSFYEGESERFPARVLFSVRKRDYKKAFARNHIKRKMREAYRLHKHVLYENLHANNKQLLFAVVFIGRADAPDKFKPTDFDEVLRKFISAVLDGVKQ